MEDNLNTQLWVFPGETPLVKFKRSKTFAKQMVTCFFSKSGHVATIPLEDRKTINSDWYINHCLPKVFEEWCKCHPHSGTQGSLLHNYNASAHIVAATLNFLTENSVNLVTHPPYSPEEVAGVFHNKLNAHNTSPPPQPLEFPPKLIKDLALRAWRVHYLTFFATRAV